MQDLIPEQRKVVAFYRIRASVKKRVAELADKLKVSEAEVVDRLLDISLNNVNEEGIYKKNKRKKKV